MSTQEKPWQQFKYATQWERYIKDLLKRNDRALFRAVVLIYNDQTDEEQMRGEAIDENGIGFSKIDAKELSEIARKIMSKKDLTEAEYARLRNKMPKYWKQLMVLAKQKQAREKARMLGVIDGQLKLPLFEGEDNDA